MSLLRLSIKWKKIRNRKLNSDEIGILEVFYKPTDYTRRTKIDELVAYVTNP
jgi:hypothetical protein